jgi:hypothetical protein
MFAGIKFLLLSQELSAACCVLINYRSPCIVNEAAYQVNWKRFPAEMNKFTARRKNGSLYLLGREPFNEVQYGISKTLLCPIGMRHARVTISKQLEDNMDGREEMQNNSTMTKNEINHVVLLVRFS